MSKENIRGAISNTELVKFQHEVLYWWRLDIGSSSRAFGHHLPTSGVVTAESLGIASNMQSQPTVKRHVI